MAKKKKEKKKIDTTTYGELERRATIKYNLGTVKERRVDRGTVPITISISMAAILIALANTLDNGVSVGGTKNGQGKGLRTQGNWKIEAEAEFQRALCSTCPVNMICDNILGGQYVSVRKRIEKGYPCIEEIRKLSFTYYESLVLSVNRVFMDTWEINDHGMYGYSTSTSQGITRQLKALVELGLLGENDVDTELNKFRKRKPKETKKIREEEAGVREEAARRLTEGLPDELR